MATARRATKEVTTTETVYTLELSEAEARNLKEYLSQTANGWATPILSALRTPLETPSPAPLAVGDRVRVLDYGYCEGQTGTLRKIDTDDIPYLVAIDDVEDTYWACKIERISA